MNNRSLLLAGGLGALSLALVALPSPSATSQDQKDSAASELLQQAQELQSRYLANPAAQAELQAKLARAQALATRAGWLVQQEEKARELENLADGNQFFFSGDESASWLGVETHEVDAEHAKELKLSSEHGVVVGKVIPDSPAAKSGLKEKDVITDINGQRVEGATQFRRMIREIPAGRTVQITVWRDGRSQTMSATLGKSEEGNKFHFQASPGTYAFAMPEIAEIPEMNWSGILSPGGRARLGIDAEDLSGQFGAYFGAPEGEGVLVRDVNSGSPAEKAGLKAGDVIVSLDGERIRSVGDLREKLVSKNEEKDQTVKLGVLRSKSEITLTAELPSPAQKMKRSLTHHTNI